MKHSTIQIVPCDSVFVPEDRQRKKTNQKTMNKLRISIWEEDGLLHPPSVLATPDDTKPFRLISGFRRYTICNELPSKVEHGSGILFNKEILPVRHIPVVVYDATGLDDFGIKRLLTRVELHENLMRENLTPLDEAEALVRLDQLNLEESESSKLAKQYTMEERAGKIREEGREVSRDSLARAYVLKEHAHLERVQKASSGKEALHAIKEHNDRVRAREIEKAFGEKTQKHQILCGDYREYLQHLEGRFDCVVTDPPYGIGMDEERGQSIIHSHKYLDSQAYFEELVKTLPTDLGRITTPQATIFVFCDYRFFSYLYQAFSKIPEFSVWNRPLIYDKKNRGTVPDVKTGLRRSYECILYINKGGKQVLRCRNEVFSYIKDTRTEEIPHAAQKPAQLYADLITIGCEAGQSVIDPFCGSGTIFYAADLTNTQAFGVEILEDHVKDLVTHRNLEEITYG